MRSDAADKALVDGFAAYELGTDEGNDAGNAFLEAYLMETQLNMAGCSDEIKQAFSTVESNLRDFQDQYCNLAKEVGTLNYNDNQEYVDD